jgi:hypothetical protein
MKHTTQHIISELTKAISEIQNAIKEIIEYSKLINQLIEDRF